MPDFVESLSGDQEVGGGDPDRSGVALLTSAGRGVLRHIGDGVDDIILAHIHPAPAGVNGPVVVDFMFPEEGLVGCVPPTTTSCGPIRRNPAGFYVNVHSVEFPAGAVRGQLG